MRILIDDVTDRELGAAVEDDDLRALYRPLRERWLRASMVSTADGSAAGADGLSGSINDEADHRVFTTLRALADAVVVGAGTARAEGYGTDGPPLVLVSGRGEVPEGLREATRGSVLLATRAQAPGLAEARDLLGEEHVLVLGDDEVDLASLPDALAGRGWHSLLCEGGPGLLGSMLDAGVVDELCLTVVPRLLAGDAPRIATGPEVDLPAEPVLLLEHEGTLLGRWVLERGADAGPAA